MELRLRVGARNDEKGTAIKAYNDVDDYSVIPDFHVAEIADRSPQ